jgi:hypothetical protein
MQIAIRENFSLQLYGFAGVAVDKNWGRAGMGLMDQLWQEVKSKHLKNKGINVWVYEPGDSLFTGVELESPPPTDTTLEQKQIYLPRYAYCKHIGLYDKIKETGTKAMQELNQRGLQTRLPYLEIYGHWTDDTSKLETELLWCLL